MIVKKTYLEFLQSKMRLSENSGFDIVDRVINRFSNPGETVFDPFAGLFTVPFRAMKLGRKGVGTELNPESFRDGLFYLRKQEIDMSAPTLFNMINEQL